MRTTTAAQDIYLAAKDRKSLNRFHVEDADGVMQDISDFYISGEISADEDTPISAATIVLWRKQDGASLSPLIEGSSLNRDSTGAYAPLVNPYRRITVETAPLLPGEEVVEGDWLLLWEGLVDEIDWGGFSSRVVINARDPMAKLHDRIIETVSEYGTESGQAIEDVMQEILDDNFGSEFVLVTIGDPDFVIFTYELGNVSVLDALKELADLIGWNLHWRWLDSPGEFGLVFYEPDRDNVTSAYTFGPDDYYDVARVGLGVHGIRNAGEVLFSDNNDEQQSVTDDRSNSIAIYGRRFIRLDERNGPIFNGTLASELLSRVLDDLEEPSVLQEIEAAFHFPIELGDLYTYLANGEHYDTDQDWAVFGYRHILTPDRCRTIISASGKASGGFDRWHRREGTGSGGRAALASVEVTFDANGQAVVSVTGASDTSAIYVTVGDGTEPADPTSVANNGEVLGRSGTIETGVKVTTGRDAFVKVVVEDGTGAIGPVSSAKQARRLGPFHKDTSSRSHTGDTVETTLDTIAIPAGVLGTNGGMRFGYLMTLNPNATAVVRVNLNGELLALATFGGSAVNRLFGEVLIFNDGATNDQRIINFTVSNDGGATAGVTNQAEDSTADMDITVTIELGLSTDTATLSTTFAELIGTD